jgi:hypothetical protein
MTRLLLCTDLDRTLLPNGPQRESKTARERFRRLAERPEVTLAYVTGRHRALVDKAIRNYSIPQPDFVIADVGSTIYQNDGKHWQAWEAWDAAIGQDWGGKSNAQLHELLTGIKELRLQEHNKQNTHKLSYYVPLYVNQVSLLASIQALLDQQGIRANLVWSVDEPANIGLLDILPASAGKRQAIEFLMQQLDFSLQETVFAGDSGNDIGVMASPVQSVLVANAAQPVRQAVMRQARINRQTDTVYLAKGDYLGMNGHYSAGILEGVAHYIPQAEAWFGSVEE